MIQNLIVAKINILYKKAISVSYKIKVGVLEDD
jgi:hypothetical protein